MIPDVHVFVRQLLHIEVKTLIQINVFARPNTEVGAIQRRSCTMSSGETIYLGMSLFVFVAFGFVLAVQSLRQGKTGQKLK